MGLTLVQRLRFQFVELKILLGENPHVDVEACKLLVFKMAQETKRLRWREIRNEKRR
jgi:hypothetical protein